MIPLCKSWSRARPFITILVSLLWAFLSSTLSFQIKVVDYIYSRLYIYTYIFVMGKAILRGSNLPVLFPLHIVSASHLPRLLGLSLQEGWETMLRENSSWTQPIWLWHIITERGQTHLLTLRLSPGPELHSTNSQCFEVLCVYFCYLFPLKERTDWLNSCLNK